MRRGRGEGYEGFALERALSRRTAITTGGTRHEQRDPGAAGGGARRAATVRVVDLEPDAAARDAGDPAAAGVRAVGAVPDRGRSRATTSAGRPGTGTTSPAASTPGPISTRRRTGSPARTAPTASPTRSPCSASSAPACVVDCSKRGRGRRALRDGARRTSRRSRRQHGRIPAGAWVLMRTDWSKRSDPAAFLNVKDDGPAHAGAERRRRCACWSRSATSTASGSRRSAPTTARRYAFEPPFPAHNLMHGAGKLRPRLALQPRPAAADRRAPDHRAAQDRARLRQPLARAGADSGLSGGRKPGEPGAIRAVVRRAARVTAAPRRAAAHSSAHAGGVGRLARAHHRAGGLLRRG